VAGLDETGVKSSGRGIRNVYQLIVVDNSTPGEIWQFVEIRSGGTLSVPIIKGHTYHFLFLGEHFDAVNTDDLTLLASGYLKATMSMEASANKLSLLMTPLVVDTAFVRNGTGKDLH
jgi:hypothetical protein